MMEEGGSQPASKSIQPEEMFRLRSEKLREARERSRIYVDSKLRRRTPAEKPALNPAFEEFDRMEEVEKLNRRAFYRESMISKPNLQETKSSAPRSKNSGKSSSPSWAN